MLFGFGGRRLPALPQARSITAASEMQWPEHRSFYGPAQLFLQRGARSERIKPQNLARYQKRAVMGIIDLGGTRMEEMWDQSLRSRKLSLQKSNKR